MSHMNYHTTLRGSLLCVLAGLVTSFAVAAPDYRNIAFYPVPLKEEPKPASLQLAGLEILGSSSRFNISSNDTARISAEEYQANMRQLEMDEGPFAIALSEQAEALGDLQAKLGNHDEAIKAYEKSLHVQRVNDGLNSEHQESLLRKMISSQVANNAFEQAHSLHESLLYLQKNLYEEGTSGYVASILEWADWNVDRLLMQDVSLGGQGAGNIGSMLVSAQESYITAIEMIRTDEAVTPDQKQRLVHAEKKLAAINYIANSKTQLASSMAASSGSAFSNNDGFSPDNQRENQSEMAYFFNGSNALKRAIAYSLEDPQPDYLAIAEQMMALGDWYLLFDRRAAALSVYEDAYEVLDAVQASDQDISRIMTPGMPVIAPDTTNPATTAYHGYIDVEFQVSKFGIASSPEVIATSEQDVSPVTKALVRKIRREKFRPAFIDGSATSGENVKLRYYYSYN